MYSRPPLYLWTFESGFFTSFLVTGLSKHENVAPLPLSSSLCLSFYPTLSFCLSRAHITQSDRKRKRHLSIYRPLRSTGPYLIELINSSFKKFFLWIRARLWHMNSIWMNVHTREKKTLNCKKSLPFPNQSKSKHSIRTNRKSTLLE